MKKITLTLFISLFFTFSALAQTVDSPERKKAVTEINNLNEQVIALFKEEKYDEALKVALNIRTLAEKNGLSNDVRVLPSLQNLAEIYLTKSRESEAIATFQKVLEAYQSNAAENGVQIARLTERLGTVYFVKKDYGKAEEFFLRALPLRERLNGADSKEIANVNNALAGIHRQKGSYEKARLHYLKAIEINDRILSETEKDSREDISNYKCFLYHKAYAENDMTKASNEIKEFDKTRGVSDPGERSVESGIVNGKAVKLVKPSYPNTMLRADGFVLVRVTIDEQGNVVSAKATCGILGFVESVEDAARRSKFTPTLLKGQPVKVTGMLIYNFKRF